MNMPKTLTDFSHIKPLCVVEAAEAAAVGHYCSEMWDSSLKSWRKQIFKLPPAPLLQPIHYNAVNTFHFKYLRLLNWNFFNFSPEWIWLLRLGRCKYIC